MRTPRISIWLSLLVAAWATSVGPVLACPICFQVEQGPVTDGVRAAVVVLLAVTLGVLAGFGTFIRRFWRRTQALAPSPNDGASS